MSSLQKKEKNKKVTKLYAAKYKQLKNAIKKKLSSYLKIVSLFCVQKRDTRLPKLTLDHIEVGATYFRFCGYI